MSKEAIQDGRTPIDIYIDVDSLLDFRLSTVSRLNDEFASTLLTEEYIDRYHDGKFFEAKGGIPQAVFDAEYAKRDATYLIGAYPTSIYWYLGLLISEKMVSNDQPGGHRYVRVTINTWPFTFSDEAVNSLENAVSIYLDSKVDIRSIHEHPSKLNPASVRQRFTDMFMYDFNYWMQIHLTEVMSSVMHPTTIWTPSIKRGKEIDIEQQAEIQNHLKHSTNPFEHTRAWLMDNVQLNYMDTRHFSVELKQHPVGGK